MTDEEVFNILQLAEDMSHKNWMHFKLLYSNKFKEAKYRIKELEAALREIENRALAISVCANNRDKIKEGLSGIAKTVRSALNGGNIDD